MKAISINCDKIDWVGMVLRGTKTVETRNQRTLDPVVGEAVALIRRKGNDRKVVALVIFGPIAHTWTTSESFFKDYKLHRVCRTCPYHEWHGVKYGYPIRVVQKFAKPIHIGAMQKGNGSWTVRILTPEEENLIRKCTKSKESR